MYLEAINAASPPRPDPAGIGEAIPLCVLLELCRLFKMEDECQTLVSFRNRTSFQDAFPPRPKGAIMVMLSLFSLLGTLGNALVLYVYVRKKNKLASTVFIICLATTDFMTSCIIMPFTMIMESLDYFIVYDALCKMYFFLITCNVPFAAFVMVAIALDRYLSICRPYCRLLDSTRSQIGIVFLAVTSAMFGILTALFHGVYMTETFTVENRTEMIDNIRKDLLHKLGADNITAFCSGSGNPHCEEQTRNATAVVESLSEEKIAHCLTPPSKTVIYTGQCRFNQIIFSTFFRKTYQKVYASIFLVCFVIVFLLYISIYRSVIVRRSRRLRARQKDSSKLRRDLSLTDTINMTSKAETPCRKDTSNQAASSKTTTRISPHGGNLNKLSSKNSPLEDDLRKMSTTQGEATLKNTSSEEPLLESRPPPADPSPTTPSLPMEKGLEMSEMSRSDGTRAANNCTDNTLKEKYLLANLRTAFMLFVVTLVFVLAFLPSWLMAHGVLRFQAVLFYCYFLYNVSNPVIYAFLNPTFRKELQDVVSCQGLRLRGTRRNICRK